MPPPLNRRDLPWIALLTASFVSGLAVSWHRWGNPLVDRGREMNQPLRLAGGEMLYSDVRHIYGPLSPYLHAGLYRLFGASLDVLYADGIITSALILALVYWLARQMMDRLGAVVATSSVMWLCVFRFPGGNYILPYSYNALHGAALGLVTLAVLMAALRNSPQRAEQLSDARDGKCSEIRSGRHGYFVCAGICAALTTLAKTEMGFAAMAAGITAALLTAYPNPGRSAFLVASFLTPSVTLIVGVYAFFAARVGWHTLSADSWLLLRNMPPELVYFNKRISGFDRLGTSLWQMLAATGKLGILAAVILATTWVVTQIGRRYGSALFFRPAMGVKDVEHLHLATWPFIAASVSVLLPLAATLDWNQGFVVIMFFYLNGLWAPLAASLDWDKGPYLAMPLVLGGLLVFLLIRFRNEATAASPMRFQTIGLIICAVYALASLPRVILQVRTDGVYSSYLLPASALMATYCWAGPFAGIFRDRRAQDLARTIALTLLLVDVGVTAGVRAHEFRANNTAVQSVRGTILAAPGLGLAWNEALEYIEQQTAPSDAIAVIPEGTSLNFFSGRRNPLREEIITPGYLDDVAEARAIRQLREADTKLILVTNRPTPEFGAALFGRDYCRLLMQWIEKNYEAFAMFGPDKNPNLQIGSATFFIRAYRRKGTLD